jgi:hypothetical protein
MKNGHRIRNIQVAWCADKKEAIALEAKLIHKYRPELNVVYDGYRGLGETMGSKAIISAVQKAGGVKKVARSLRVTTQAIYFYLNGQRPPSEEFLKHIGIERVVKYRRKRK